MRKRTWTGRYVRFLKTTELNCNEYHYTANTGDRMELVVERPYGIAVRPVPDKDTYCKGVLFYLCLSLADTHWIKEVTRNTVASLEE